MITLLSEQLAPITSRLGFLEVPLPVAAEAVSAWKYEPHGTPVARSDVHGDVRSMLLSLEPLTQGVTPRTLLGETRPGTWTAYFDSGLHGSNASSAVGYLSQRLGCRGVVVDTVPHTMRTRLETPGRFGAVQFTLYGPEETDWLNVVRSLSAIEDGGRWSWQEMGELQEFEDPSAYQRRRVRDRLTTEMVARYCAALGVEPFDEQFYGSRAVLVEAFAGEPRFTKSLAETQQFLGIVPGLADRLPG